MKYYTVVHWDTKTRRSDVKVKCY